jgi:hypothetical protein
MCGARLAVSVWQPRVPGAAPHEGVRESRRPRGRAAGASLDSASPGPRTAGARVGAGPTRALAATTLLEGLLFGLDSHKPATVAGTMVGLTSIVVAAASGPAMRGSRVEPLTALARRVTALSEHAVP